MDECSKHTVNKAYKALKTLGWEEHLELGYRDAFVLFGVKGAFPGTVP